MRVGEGDLVELLTRGPQVGRWRRVAVLVIQWSGRVGSLGLLMDARGQLYRDCPDALTRYPDSAETRQLAAAIADFAASKRGRQILTNSRGRVVTLEDARRKRHDRSPMPEPEPGATDFGALMLSDVPLKTAIDMSSRLTAHMDWRLSALPAYQAQLRDIQRRVPQHWWLYMQHVHLGRTLKDAAAELGITPAAARKRYERTRREIAAGLREALA